MPLAVGPLHAVRWGRRPECVATRPEQGDPAIVAAQAPPPDPADLAERPELVEEPWLVARDAGRQDVTFQHGRRDRDAGQLVDDLGQSLQRGRATERRRIGARAAHRCDRVPRRQEPAERVRIDRLDLAPEAGERPAAQEPKDVRVAPLALGATRPELAEEQRTVGEQSLQGIGDDPDRQAPAAGRFGRQERAVGAGKPGEQPFEGARRPVRGTRPGPRPAPSRQRRRGSARRPRWRSSARRRRSGRGRRGGRLPARSATERRPRHHRRSGH